MERARRVRGSVHDTQFVREAILLRCVVASGEATDEIRALAAALSKS
jgi:hypothetical protein